MTNFSVTIIGMGPRGLSVLERVATIARERADRSTIQINIVDPGEYGQGVHSARQPLHLLVNTVSSQVTMFPTHTAVRADASGGTPSFLQWARSAGYRRFGSEYYRVGAPAGEDLTDADHLPRRLLGEYLTWFCETVLKSLSHDYKVTFYRDIAVDVRRQRRGRYSVHLGGGFVIASDFVFITTGHGRNAPGRQDTLFQEFVSANTNRNPQLAYFSNVYPVEILSKVSAAATVAVQGLGLTAHDVISELTVGRGGRFAYDGKSARYTKSGREPRILLFSRNCIPGAARGINQKGIAGRHKAQFFTTEAVRAARAQRKLESGNSQLDFELDVLPLLVKEMGYAYRCAKEGATLPPDGYELSEAERRIVTDLFHPVRGREFRDLTAFQAHVQRWIVDDLAEAFKGNVSSPIKAATDVVRDLREPIRAAVEYAGLTPQSHRKFVDEYVPIMNRIAFGPPKERNIELLALLEAGIVEIASGPCPRLSLDAERAQFVLESSFRTGITKQYADVLVIARLDTFYPALDSSPLMRNLVRSGFVRPYRNGTYHPGGIDIDTGCRPITREGRTLEGVWALGYLVEGPHFYTHALPRPLLDSRNIQDAQKCVAEMFDLIEGRLPVVPRGTKRPELQLAALEERGRAAAGQAA